MSLVKLERFDAALVTREAAEPSVTDRHVYWPEIDGLRAIAVLAVVAFHIGCPLVQGGFVGVDVFFVVSGFLITTLIAREMDGGRFSILHFYQRRIARIAPAAFLVVAATLLAGAIWYSARDFASLGANAVAAVFAVINVKLIFQGNYFEISPDAQPLVHYWSLAVEEQFYLIFPFLLYAAMVATRRPLAILLGLCFVSFVACVVVTPRAPVVAFYLLPTRAWELLVGSCLAIVRLRYGELDLEQARLCLLLGVVLIVLSCVILTDVGFPGWVAALPVSGSALAIAGIGAARGTMQRFLAHPDMVFVGKRSYSLYLWHWPVFSFVDYALYLGDPLLRLALKIVITAIACLLSFRFVERPMRLWLNLPWHRGVAFGALATGLLVVGVSGYAVRTSYYLNAEPGNLASGGVTVNPDGRAWVVLMGDSQASMYGLELASLAHELDFRLNILSVDAGNAMPGERSTDWPQISKFLGDRKPDVLIVAQGWSGKLRDRDAAEFGKAIAAVASRANKLIVLTEPPHAPRNATREAMRSGVRPPLFEDGALRERRASANAIIETVTRDGKAEILGVHDLFLGPDGALKIVAPDGRLIFHDATHLSDSGTALLRPRLGEALRKALAGDVKARP